MYSRAVTHSWAFWDDQPVEGERDKDQDDGHGEQEREDESGKLFFWGFTCSLGVVSRQIP